MVLRLINKMIENVDDNPKKQATFIAMLDIIGVSTFMTQCKDKENEEIDQQVDCYELVAKNFEDNNDYKLAIMDNKLDALKKHNRMLEKKVEKYSETYNLFKLMRKDLENYKIKADMSKEYATYYDAFQPVQQFSYQEMKD